MGNILVVAGDGGGEWVMSRKYLQETIMQMDLLYMWTMDKVMQQQV